MGVVVVLCGVCCMCDMCVYMDKRAHCCFKITSQCVQNSVMEKTYNGKNETEMQLRNYFTWHLEHFVYYMKTVYRYMKN
jgi:hypothetical protein